MGAARGGRIIIPTGSSITSITFYEWYQDTGTFLPCYDDTSTTPVAIALTGVAGGKTYPIPAKLFGSKYLKFVGNADGTVYVLLKG